MIECGRIQVDQDLIKKDEHLLRMRKMEIGVPTLAVMTLGVTTLGITTLGVMPLSQTHSALHYAACCAKSRNYA
jgi:hypothetical protein